MYFDRIASKRAAKELIRTRRPSPVLVTLVFILLTSGVSSLVNMAAPNPFEEVLTLIREGYDVYTVFSYVFSEVAAPVSVFLAVLLNFYTIVMGFGYNKYCLRLTRGEQGGYGTLIEGFHLAGKVILTSILMSVFIALWSMLFVIPGIIAAYRYSQAIYCLIDDPSVSPLEAIRRSKAMMRGQKFNLFVLQMTFFGWYFLAGSIVALLTAAVTAFLGAPLFWLSTLLSFAMATALDIWLTPYVQLVTTDFYNYLVGWQPGQRTGTSYQGPELEF